jgi:hypothetical protein
MLGSELQTVAETGRLSLILSFKPGRLRLFYTGFTQQNGIGNEERKCRPCEQFSLTILIVSLPSLDLRMVNVPKLHAWVDDSNEHSNGFL